MNCSASSVRLNLYGEKDPDNMDFANSIKSLNCFSQLMLKNSNIKCNS